MLQVQIRRSQKNQTINYYGDYDRISHLNQFIKNLNTEKEISSQKIKYLINEKQLVAVEIERLEYKLLSLQGAPLIKRITKTNERDAIRHTKKAIKVNAEKYNSIQDEINEIDKKTSKFDELKHLTTINNALHELGFKSKGMLTQEYFTDKDKPIIIDYVFNGDEQELDKDVVKKNKFLQEKINMGMNKYLQEKTSEDGIII